MTFKVQCASQRVIYYVKHNLVDMTLSPNQRSLWCCIYLRNMFTTFTDLLQSRVQDQFLKYILEKVQRP